MITLRETIPIFVARQRFKHTIGFSYNEVSRRYVDDTPEFYTPDTWRGKADNAKQGSSEKEIDINPYNLMVDYYKQAIDTCSWTYQELLRKGVCPEHYYVTGSLAAFARAYKLRIDKHAQKEIQELAENWNAIIKDLYPVSWEALTNGK